MTAARRGATDLAGILVIDKPAGMTSHAVVDAVRRATGERRVGHAGTLDPSATGVLVVLVGPYTRLERYLGAKEKSYRAVIAFGAETDTDDADGQVVAQAAVPPAVLSESEANDCLSSFLGPQSQLPPVYSAIKLDGRTAHRVARAGGDIDLPERPITVHDAGLVAIDPQGPTWTVDFRVSKGTYIRALARDIGRRMGTRAHLSSLIRTASGPIGIEQAISLQSVSSASDVRTLFAEPVSALGLRTLEVDDDGLQRVAVGRPLDAEMPDGECVSVVYGDRLVAVYRSQEGRLVPETVLGAVR